MPYLLNEHEISFPHPSLASNDGLLAIGGDLSPERLILAYSHGIFPWYSQGDPILWFAPHERCVIYADRLHVSKSMRKVLSNGLFTCTWNRRFDEVIHSCADIKRRGQDGTWITEEMQEAYMNLHQLGYAQSIEVWQNEELVGGMYGIRIGQIFCGESMFSKVANASKVALIWLLQHNDIKLLDCQMPNPHLMSLGAEMIPGDTFRKMLIQEGPGT
jgi:leucyl/phenylalanyl-tRNA--protein transferase